MRTQLSTFTVAALLALSAVAFVSPADAGHRHPQERHDRDGRREICQECGTVRDISRISSGSRRSNTGAIVVGALIGGALGNQVGKGDGRKAATIAGAVIGGAIGNDSARRDDYYYSEPQTRCRTVYEPYNERRIAGYDVQYRYRGDVFMSHLDYDPGERMRVRVSVSPAE